MKIFKPYPINKTNQHSFKLQEAILFKTNLAFKITIFAKGIILNYKYLMHKIYLVRYTLKKLMNFNRSKMSQISALQFPSILIRKK